jgi:hypothetical protein
MGRKYVPFVAPHTHANHIPALRPESGWLDAYNQTWFDIPGECNRIWNGGSAGVACTDTDQMTGCILGGGAAVNAGLWWRVSCSSFEHLSLSRLTFE